MSIKPITRPRVLLGQLLRLGPLETLCRHNPDRWYPIRDFLIYKRIQSAAINSIKYPYKDISAALGRALAYSYGAGVKGDVAEFGLQTGRSSVALVSGVSFLNREYSGGKHPHGTKHLHFFDSFQGLPVASTAADIDAPHVKSGVWAGGGFSAIARPVSIS